MLTNPRTRLEVNQGHQTWYHSIHWVWFPIGILYSNFVPKTHRFWDIRPWKLSWPWNHGQRSLKVIGTETDRSATYERYIAINHEPISYHFRERRRFQSKIANFSHPRVFKAPAEVVPLGIWYRRKESTRSSANADNGLDAFSGQSTSTNMVPFWVHCDFSLSMCSAPTDSLRHFHSSSVL